MTGLTLKKIKIGKKWNPFVYTKEKGQIKI